MPRATAKARVVPTGLTYRAGFLAPEEERALLDVVERLEFHGFVMRGQAARRSVRHFGWSYSSDDRRLTRADPLPEGLDSFCAQ